MGRVVSYTAFSPLPHLADGSVGRGGISLLHLSWGRPRQALPVILALWSPDFPHPEAFRPPAAAVQPGRRYIVTENSGSVNFRIPLTGLFERIMYNEAI